jgi:hypothetical protein
MVAAPTVAVAPPGPVSRVGGNMFEGRILITGCGRSGTNYTSVLLGRCGLDVAHERRLGADGISSWLFGPMASSAPWGPVPADCRFEHTFHLVRDPLAAIPSITTFNKRAWEYIGGFVPIEASDPPLLRAARYWYHWNTMVEDRTDRRIRIQDMPAAAAEVCRVAGVPPERALAAEVPADLNTRRHGKLVNAVESKFHGLGVTRDRPLRSRLVTSWTPRYEDTTWEELEALDPGLAGKIRDKAAEYGL